MNQMATAGKVAHQAPESSAVTARMLRKEFAGGVVALEDATFTINRGQFVSLVGPSGCGKSTLLRLVSALIPRSSGSLRVQDVEVVTPRTDVGLMFQKPTLLPWKTSLENARLASDLRRSDRAHSTRRALDLLKMVGLAGFEYSYPAHLSGGMQQRVALARLLMTDAELMLLDEPFGALDEFTRERLNLELIGIHEKLCLTTMFVTHNIAEAVFLSDRVLVMTPRPGKIERIVTIPFPRPRTVELMRTPEFNDLVFDIRAMLGEDA